ncbi:uncharacterized protein FFB20_15679 [Fusarium fujikuroi]|nr:uncharacterized protein FFB20_15679 [Fusarium fujikuroi]
MPLSQLGFWGSLLESFL